MLARRFLYAIAAIIFLILGVAIVWTLFGDRMLRFAFVPRVAFSAPPGAVDYADPANWVARPGKTDDPSSYLPAGVTRTPPPRVAVFFVAPTTYLARDRWNAPLDDSAASDRLHLFVASEASVFTAAGQVWAPRYRQATAGAFLTDQDAANRALAFAYADVERAFEAFLRAIPADEPILLAGHSQGSLHLVNLLARRVAGTPVARRIVAVYLGGWPVSVTADLPRLGLPGCTRAGQPGCIVAWQSFAEPADPALVTEVYNRTRGLTGAPRRDTPMLCVNPLTGVTGAAPASANLGSLVPTADLSGGALMTRRVPARCDPTGLLLIGPEPEGYGAYVLPGRNFHVFDYALFWANLRADAAARAAAYLKTRW